MRLDIGAFVQAKDETAVRQRITTTEWKKILLSYGDKFIRKGAVRQLVAKDIGFGVVEVSILPEVPK